MYDSVKHSEFGEIFKELSVSPLHPSGWGTECLLLCQKRLGRGSV